MTNIDFDITVFSVELVLQSSLIYHDLLIGLKSLAVTHIQYGRQATQFFWSFFFLHKKVFYAKLKLTVFPASLRPTVYDCKNTIFTFWTVG